MDKTPLRVQDAVYDRAKIRVTYACNNDCEFCECASLRRISDPDIKQIAQKIALAAEQKFGTVIFTGGEPTLRKDLPNMIALARRLGLRSGLVTNGRALRFRDYAERLVREGLSTVQLSLHGDCAAVHDKLTRSNSFFESMDALRVLHDLKLELSVNCVLTRPNLSGLNSLAEILLPFAPLRFKLSMIEPRRLDAARFEALVPTLSEAGTMLAALFAYLDNTASKLERFEAVAAGLPMCVLPGYHDRLWDLRRSELAEIAETYDKTFKRLETVGRSKPDTCRVCRHVETCPGVYDDYFAMRGASELKPEGRSVSNSFAYEPVRRLPGFGLSPCPILSGAMSLDDPGRSLLIANENGAELYRTDSADFASEQINRTKVELGQIYLDISGKLFHEDFELDMAKLRPDPICTACERFAHCPALYHRVTENVFGAAEKEIIALIGCLSGEVLDVGGGPIRYTEAFGKRMTDRAMHYTVVEPDPPSVLLDFLRKYGIENRLQKGLVEDLEFKKESFDWVLVLRSHNHLYDLRQAYKKFAGWLRPGGRMVVVDNTAYGIARSRELWASIRQRGGIPDFQHYNNHDSHEATSLIVEAGFELLEHHPVTPETANQWWCLFRKPE